MDKWNTLLQLLYFLRGYNVHAPPDKQVPLHYLDALAEVVVDRPTATQERIANLEKEIGEYEELLAKITPKR